MFAGGHIWRSNVNDSDIENTMRDAVIVAHGFVNDANSLISFVLGDGNGDQPDQAGMIMPELQEVFSRACDNNHVAGPWCRLTYWIKCKVSISAVAQSDHADN